MRKGRGNLTDYIVASAILLGCAHNHFFIHFTKMPQCNFAQTNLVFVLAAELDATVITCRANKLILHYMKVYNLMNRLNCIKLPRLCNRFAQAPV